MVLSSLSLTVLMCGDCCVEKDEGELSPASKVSGKELKCKHIVSPPELLRDLLRGRRGMGEPGRVERQEETRSPCSKADGFRLPKASEGSHSTEDLNHIGLVTR